MIIYLFRIIIETYRLLTPEVCYLDVDNQKVISQQFGLLSDTLYQKNIEFSQFKHSFQDITGVKILTHKQAIKEYEKYLKYCYKLNKKPWKNAFSNQCYAREMNFTSWKLVLQ